MDKKGSLAADSFAERMRQSGVWDLLEEYMDIRDELEETLDSFRWLQDELRYAMEDISEELENLETHIVKVSRQLKRFKSPKAKQYDVVNEQDDTSPFHYSEGSH